jgi:hypothetical protein
MNEPTPVDMNLAKALDLSIPEPEVLPARAPVRVSAHAGATADADIDYREVRDNLKRVIMQSEEATQSILEVAQDSQNPRAYEVVAQLINANLEANNKLITLHKQMKEIKKEEESRQTNITNNSIFVGSTADLQKMIRDMRKKELPDAPQAG